MTDDVVLAQSGLLWLMYWQSWVRYPLIANIFIGHRDVCWGLGVHACVCIVCFQISNVRLNPNRDVVRCIYLSIKKTIQVHIKIHCFSVVVITIKNTSYFYSYKDNSLYNYRKLIIITFLMHHLLVIALVLELT